MGEAPLPWVVIEAVALALAQLAPRSTTIVGAECPRLRAEVVLSTRRILARSPHAWGVFALAAEVRALAGDLAAVDAMVCEFSGRRRKPARAYVVAWQPHA